MPFISGDDHLPRRNARSFDLDDSATKAAAWVWHLHTSNPGVTTEGRFISSQSRRRSSDNFDRKATRFRQEASTTTKRGASGSLKTDASLWDCGSNLYDTFELVSFGNWLDRSLMEDVVPMTPLQPRRQEHHMHSPLHRPSGILRTSSLPRSLSQQTCKKHHTEVASPSPSPSKFKLSKPETNGRAKARSSTSSDQKASTRWCRVAKFMNAMKKVVVLHKQVSLVGCKRSIEVIESSQRPLDSISEIKDDVCARGTQLSVTEKVRANLSTSNLKEGECIGDESPKYHTKVRNSNGGTRGNYKLSIPIKDQSNCQSNRFDLAMQKKVKDYGCSESFGSGLSASTMASAKIRSYSDSIRDEILSEHKKIRPRRRCAGGDVVFMDDRIKGSNLGVNNVKERSRVANENVDYHKHLHHHHHHHHHHYLYHNLASESERLSPETMSRICAEQGWLI